MNRRTRWRWLMPVGLLLAWLAIGGVAGPFAGKLADVAENDNAAFLPADAESTEVADAQDGFTTDETTPAVVVWEGGEQLSDQSIAAIDNALQEVATIDGVATPVSPPVPAEDGVAVSAFIDIDTADTDDAAPIVEQIREVVDVDGLDAYVTGPAGFAVDLGSAFEGIDGVLLLVALSVVLVILLVVYRSPVLPFVVLLSALFALGAASFVVYQLADDGTLTLNGQSQGIMFILVVGAATDYALLLVARFREELRENSSSFDAMAVALRQAAGPIAASALTVIVGVLCLLLSELSSNRSLGPVAALGVAGALVAALTFLPAMLALLGRAAFWPFRPMLGSPHPEQKGLWGRVAGIVSRRPRRIWVGVTVVLAAMAALLPMFRADGVAESELFLNRAESAEGQEVLARHFPGGAGSPAVIVTGADSLGEVSDLVAAAPGVSTAAPVTDEPRTSPGGPAGEPLIVDGRVLVEATLSDPADSDAAIATVRDLRTRLDDIGGDVLVGGRTAQLYDTNEISQRDRTVIIPVVLAVILLVLIVLLRAILAPVLLIATVVLSFAATLGIAALVFNHIFEWPGADPGVPLFAFVFLVALGIDYNIFLMTRVREESVQQGTRPGIRTGLAVTGGVITSAGIVLAATFSALSVIPILFLAQIAFLVAFGVLLDTFIVRSLLVPALAYDMGPRVWWPSALEADADADEPVPNRQGSADR